MGSLFSSPSPGRGKATQGGGEPGASDLSTIGKPVGRPRFDHRMNVIHQLWTHGMGKP